jgi:uncharacterized protein YceH (UPF0502 family)
MALSVTQTCPVTKQEPIMNCQERGVKENLDNLPQESRHRAQIRTGNNTAWTSEAL